jgi:RNA polymerase sigma factor for flagellar operon FliA
MNKVAERKGVDGEEALLWQAFRGPDAEAARGKLFSLHLPFARGLAARHFRGRSSPDIEFPDLYQLACAGLLEAIDRFDPAHGNGFRAFARGRITGSIVDGISQMSELREQISFRNRVRRERVRSLGPETAVEDMKASDAVEALAGLAVGLALGFMLEGTGMYVADAQTDARPAGSYESLSWKQTVKQLQAELAGLPDRERQIIERHYGEGLTFDSIGSLMGIGKARVSQLHRGALALLRKRLHKAGDFRLQR